MLENYELLDNGIIKQKQIFQKIDYNLDYSKIRYDSYGELTNYMSYMRYGYLIGTLGRIPTSIVDVGYGNGSFLNVCKETIQDCYGFDVSDYPVPFGCKKIDNLNSFFDVVTFFDSLEHFEDISFVKDLNCNYICISVPYCHYFSDDWFFEWKHRRPDEHLWHFNETSLINFMESFGYNKINITNVEDNIRKTSNSYQNILVGVFKKNT